MQFTVLAKNDLCTVQANNENKLNEKIYKYFTQSHTAIIKHPNIYYSRIRSVQHKDNSTHVIQLEVKEKKIIIMNFCSQKLLCVLLD